MRTSIAAAVLSLLTLLALAPPGASGQCQRAWIPGEQVAGLAQRPDLASCSAMIAWAPDGPGPRPPMLVVSGNFSVAGGTLCNNVAAFDGERWSGFGDNLSGQIYAF